MPISDKKGLSCALGAAVARNDLQAVEKYLNTPIKTEGSSEESYLDDQACDQSGLSILFNALKSSTPAIFAYLIEHQKKTDLIVSYKDVGILSESADSNAWKRIIAFCKKYKATTAEQKKEYGQALLYAVSKQNYEAAKALLEAGADTSISQSLVLHKISYGYVSILPIQLAIYRLDLEMLSLLLKFNADPKIKCNKYNAYGPCKTVFEFAVYLLIVFKSNNDKKKIWACILLICEKYPATTDEDRNAYAKLLVLAVEKGLHSVAKRLLEAGASRSAEPLLHYAVDNQDERMASLLLAHGFSLDRKHENETALELAVRSKLTSMEKVLVENGTDYKPWYGEDSNQRSFGLLAASFFQEKNVKIKAVIVVSVGIGLFFLSPTPLLLGASLTFSLSNLLLDQISLNTQFLGLRETNEVKDEHTSTDPGQGNNCLTKSEQSGFSEKDQIEVVCMAIAISLTLGIGIASGMSGPLLISGLIFISTLFDTPLKEAESCLEPKLGLTNTL